MHPSFTKPELLGNQDKNIEIIYDHILYNVVEPLIGNTTTYGSDLEKLAKSLFGIKFLGVFPSDKIPKIKSGYYAIVNLDEADLKGSHWVAIVGNGGSRVLVYDSFGRDARSLLPAYSKNVDLIGTDLHGSKKHREKLKTHGVLDTDAEQSPDQKNCGARVITALIIFDRFGKNCFMAL